RVCFVSVVYDTRTVGISVGIPNPGCVHWLVTRVVCEPGHLVSLSSVVSGSAGATGVFPLFLSRQTIDVAVIYLIQLLDELLRLVPAHVLHRICASFTTHRKRAVCFVSLFAHGGAHYLLPLRLGYFVLAHQE